MTSFTVKNVLKRGQVIFQIALHLTTVSLFPQPKSYYSLIYLEMFYHHFTREQYFSHLEKILHLGARKMLEIFLWVFLFRSEKEKSLEQKINFFYFFILISCFVVQEKVEVHIRKPMWQETGQLQLNPFHVTGLFL